MRVSCGKLDARGGNVRMDRRPIGLDDLPLHEASHRDRTQPDG